MKKKIKFFLEMFLFIVIFIIIFDRLTLLFVRKGNGYGTDVLNFYQQEKNSIDVLFLGSSHAYSSFNPYLIYDETKLNSYVFSTQQQPIWITYYYLKEALKYQTPQYVVLEVHMAIAGNEDYAQEQVNRDAIDKMKMSLNKIEVINASVKEEDRMFYYFNIMKYHTRYKELNGVDIKTVLFNYTIDNKGYIALPDKGYTFDYNDIEKTDDIINLTDKNEKYLKSIIELCEKNNIELILVKTPSIYGSYGYGRLNYIEKLAVDNDILFINYIENINKLNLNYEEDFFDSGHLNSKGSDKLSLDFCNYLEV